MTEMYANTVQFRFPPGSARPTWMEIASFVKQLDTDVMTMETTYKTAQSRSLFIKFISLDAMTESMRKNVNPRKFVYSSGESVEVRMSVAGTNVRYIRVFDLPPELPDDNLISALESFGKVERVIREKFPPELGLGHMFNGVRGVYMDVTKDIPPSLDVVGTTGRIFYDGLKDTCFLCREVGHKKESCPQRQFHSNRKERKEKHASISYAAVVSGEEVISEERIHSDISEDDVIEVLEEAIEETAGTEKEEQATGIDEEKEIRRKKGMEALEEVAKAIQEAMMNPTANQRRAQYATSGSGSSSLPRKKVARRSYY